jgi:hypothetical protein
LNVPYAETRPGPHPSRQQLGNGDLDVGFGERSNVPIGWHDRDVGIMESSGPIRVRDRIAVNFELADKL